MTRGYSYPSDYPPPPPDAYPSVAASIAYPPPGYPLYSPHGYPPIGYPPHGHIGYPPVAYPLAGYPSYPPTGYPVDPLHRHAQRPMEVLTADGAATATIYGAYHMSHGHGMYDHHHHGCDHYGKFKHHGKFKHGKFGRKHDHHGKWK